MTGNLQIKIQNLLKTRKSIKVIKKSKYLEKLFFLRLKATF